MTVGSFSVTSALLAFPPTTTSFASIAAHASDKFDRQTPPTLARGCKCSCGEATFRPQVLTITRTTTAATFLHPLSGRFYRASRRQVLIALARRGDKSIIPIPAPLQPRRLSDRQCPT